MILLCLMLCPIESSVTEVVYGLSREVAKILIWCSCNVIPTLPLKKLRGGSSLGSLCGGSRCCLYSTRERGRGGVCYALSCHELRSLMYSYFKINEDLIPFQNIRKHKAEI
jgi:hypothetical protein